MRPRIALLVVALLTLLLAGCGLARAGVAAVGVAAPSPTPTRWVAYGPDSTQIASVSVDKSGRVLTIKAKVLAGQAGCARDLVATLDKFYPKLAAELGEPTTPQAEYVTLTYQSLWQLKCPSTRVETVQVTLPTPLGHLSVVINTLSIYTPTHGSLLKLCGEAGQDFCGPFPVIPAACTDRSYGQAMETTAPPQGATYWARGCDGHWLVLDVDWPGGPAGCDAPCHPAMTATRTFFKAGSKGWITVATAQTGGCSQVHHWAPQFPSSLCASLPPPGQQ
ncbi:MAG TPA: hypothetical protein VMU95_02225 [Trebonia sp.]|nr:hypothetical protein [Trebonia sp.]